jgi:hypothetical protein
LLPLVAPTSSCGGIGLGLLVRLLSLGLHDSTPLGGRSVLIIIFVVIVAFPVSTLLLLEPEAARVDERDGVVHVDIERFRGWFQAKRVQELVEDVQVVQ